MNADDNAINPASRTVPGGGTEETTEFRCTARQLQNLLMAVVIAFVVAVVAGVIAVGARRSSAAGIAVIGGLCEVVFLYAYVAYVLARTVSEPGGISVRGVAGRYEYRWEQIDNVACRRSPHAAVRRTRSSLRQPTATASGSACRSRAGS